MTARALLYLDAARHMHAGQLVGRARRIVPPVVLAAGAGSPPPWQPNAAGVGVDRAPSSGETPPPEETGEFSAVGVSRRFGDPGFWEDRGDGLLFLFHLHGFAPLAAYAAGPSDPAGDAFWEKVVAGWLEANSRPAMPAWHPYPTSIRILAWSAALSRIAGWAEAFRSRLAAELWRQARYLRRAIEHDVGGNHVIKNATALVGAGAVFPDSSLMDAGLALLRRESARQILPDGGHEERSTSYHRQVRLDLEDTSTLVQATRGSTPGWLRDRIAMSESWEAEIAGPGGVLPLLNDAWEVPPFPNRRNAEVTHLADSGYAILRHREDQAIFDVGPICPPHLPPHAHADVLSLVMWADGMPLLVDPGSYSYTGEARALFRGTAAHNTVEVDGQDQCEFWGDFRNAHQPRVRVGSVRREGGAVVVAASHDGYRRLADGVIHHRTLVWAPGDGLVAVDLLRGRGEHAVRSSLHVAPGARVEGTRRVGGFEVCALGRGAGVTATEGSYSPHLGRAVAATVLEDRRTIGVETPFGWSVLRGDAAVTSVERGRLVLRRGDGSSVSIALEWD